MAALYGPLHGGANEAVLGMLQEIGTVESVPMFIAQVKRKERRLMGFGHRIYRNYDPRARIIQRIAHEVFEACGREPLIEVAIALERTALEDEYFLTRKLYPNVDFYSGLIYRGNHRGTISHHPASFLAMGFPSDFFPVLFAIPRVAGWLAHWRESLLTADDGKIWRPRQIFTGNDIRPFIPMHKRRNKDGSGDGVKINSHLFNKRYTISLKSKI